MSTGDFCGLRAGFARPQGAGLDAPTRRGTSTIACGRWGTTKPPFLSLLSCQKGKKRPLDRSKKGKSAWRLRTPPYPKNISCYGIAFLNNLMHPGNRVAAAMLYKPIRNRLGTQKFLPMTEPLSAQLLCIDL